MSASENSTQKCSLISTDQAICVHIQQSVNEYKKKARIFLDICVSELSETENCSVMLK